MKRRSLLHRFGALLCACCCLYVGWCGVARAGSTVDEQPPVTQAMPAVPVPRETRTVQSPTPPPRRLEGFKLSQERYEKAVAYSRAAYTLYFVSVALSAIVLILLLGLGIAAKYRDWAERISDRRWLQALTFVPLLVLTLDLCGLPIRIYGHVLSRKYEVSVQHWGSWFQDWGKEQLLMAGFALIVALILSVTIRRSPRRWWLYFWLAALPIILFFMFVSPWFIDPLFNTFQPLEATQPNLVASIEKLTQRAGVPIPTNHMFLMKASEKTNDVDAYVTGLGASKRIVIWDTTLQRMSADETLFVVGHELGHYVLGHVWKGFLFAVTMLFFGLYAIFRAFHWTLGRWSAAWRIYGPEDWVSLVVLLLLLEIGLFLASPVINGFSRMQEHHADIYGAEVIHGIVPNSAEAAAQAFQVLGEVDLADPNPPEFITFWLYSHPPLADRLVFAYSYNPWASGKSPKYVK
ncbi:MAG TPA: M48 family metallopeptidase [Candidatus Acidoferrum sp.]|nr:M48 family metallopeptidase [Candidatus Acidoferrum sp.]